MKTKPNRWRPFRFEIFTEVLEQIMRCQLCDGPCFKLGTLGLLVHYRCRDCGMAYSKKVKPDKRQQEAIRLSPRTSSK